MSAESLAETEKDRVWPEQHTKVLFVHLCMLPWCMWIYEPTHTWADLPVYIQLRPVFSREKRGRPENPRNRQMWTRTADLNIGNAASSYTSLSHAKYTVCVLFLPSKENKKKQQECKRFDSNWSGYYAAICIICSKGTERLGESWLEKMSQWIHISAATDWTWSFPNEPRGPMKKVFRWWEKKTRERGRKERRAGWTPSLHPFSFHRGIKSSMLDFQWSERIIPEYLLRIMN